MGPSISHLTFNEPTVAILWLSILGCCRGDHSDTHMDSLVPFAWRHSCSMLEHPCTRSEKAPAVYFLDVREDEMPAFKENPTYVSTFQRSYIGHTPLQYHCSNALVRGAGLPSTCRGSWSTYRGYTKIMVDLSRPHRPHGVCPIPVVYPICPQRLPIRVILIQVHNTDGFRQASLAASVDGRLDLAINGLSCWVLECPARPRKTFGFGGHGIQTRLVLSTFSLRLDGKLMSFRLIFCVF